MKANQHLYEQLQFLSLTMSNTQWDSTYKTKRQIKLIDIKHINRLFHELSFPFTFSFKYEDMQNIHESLSAA